MSIRLRLALWYGALTALVVVLVCFYSYAVHSRTHYDELDATLRSVAEHVAEELGSASTAAERGKVLEASLLLGTEIRVIDSAGAVREQSVYASRAPAVDPRAVLVQRSRQPYSALAALAPALHPAKAGTGAFGIAEGGERWRVYVLRISGGQYLAALLPLSHIDAAVDRFGHLMMLMATVGGGLAFLVGWLVAGRALRPVAALTDTAGAIARSREFSRRVRVSGRRGGRDELARLGEMFNEMLGSLEQAYAAQQRFVSDASHELRAPLTAIQANLELLRDRKTMGREEQERAVAEAYDEAQRLARFVADLLILARADAGGVSLRRDSVELDRVLMDVVGEARHLVRGQRLEIAAVEPCVIRGDPDRVKQLLLILVDNAIKYTPPGGKVSLALARSGAQASVAIRDTGIGIEADDLPRVFERFYRADPARSRDPGGTGLGLPIARWIADQHGGSVELESAPGRGTTATVRLLIAA